MTLKKYLKSCVFLIFTAFFLCDSNKISNHLKVVSICLSWCDLRIFLLFLVRKYLKNNWDLDPRSAVWYASQTVLMMTDCIYIIRNRRYYGNSGILVYILRYILEIKRITDAIHVHFIVISSWRRIYRSIVSDHK